MIKKPIVSVMNPGIINRIEPNAICLIQKNIILMYIYQTMSNNFGYIDIILLAMIAGFYHSKT